MCAWASSARASSATAALGKLRLGAAPRAGAGLALVLLAALWALPQEAYAQTTLVSNTGQSRTNAVTAGILSSGRLTQGFNTGNAAGYEVSSVGLHIHRNYFSSGETVTVSIHRFDNSAPNKVGDLVATLSTPSPLNGNGVRNFLAPSGALLLPNTRYLVNFVSTGNDGADLQLGILGSDAETGAEGWSIEDSYRLSGNRLNPYSVRMNVKGSVLSPFTATLASPESFVGRNLFYRFDLTLSEAVAIPFQDMRDHAFSVTNGYMAEAKRIHKDRRTEGGQQRLYSNHWRMTVVADDETKPVTVTLRGNRPCSEQGALCDGTVQLTSPPVLTLTPDTAPFDGSNLPSLSIANASATEDTSVLNFDVTLSRATQSRIAFDYRTIAGGTATANADYRPVVDTTKFIRPGETTVAAPVGLIEDTASDAGETVKVEISNARVVTDRGTAFGPLTITTAEATGTIDAPTTSTTAVPNVNLRIENTSMRERNGFMHFTVTLSRPLEDNVCYDFETLTTGTATEGEDFLARPKATLWQQAGVTEWTEFVYILDDAINDPGETVKVKISNAELCNDASKTINIGRAQATGTIQNSDPIPAAWLARFGRTVASDTIAAVTARLETPREAGSHVTLGGHRLSLDGSGAGLPPTPAGSADWLAWSEDPDAGTSRTMDARALLMGTSFRAVLGQGAGSQFTSWGQGASVSRFSGAVPGLSLSGESATGAMGMDYEYGRLLTGFAMTHSLAEGTAHGAERSYLMGSSVTTMLPYARLALSERVSAWGLAGTGSGELTLDLDGGAAERYGADLSMTLAAAGVRGELVTPAEAGGFALALKADAFWVRTESEAVSAPGAGNLAGARADASRVRAVLDGSRTFALAGGTLTPSVALGVRHDGGDAETGTGMELGAGVGYADPSRGLDMALRVHGLAGHAEDGYREWGVSGSFRLVPGGEGRGLTLSLTPSYGADAGGSERLWTMPDAYALAANDNAELSSRLDTEVGYGLGGPAGLGVLTPYAALGLAGDDARTWRAGARWNLAPDVSLGLEGTRSESAADPAEHGAMLRGSVRW